MGTPAPLAGALFRFGAGWAGSLAVGLAAFGSLDWAARSFGQFEIFQGTAAGVLAGGQPPSQCVTVGALVAAILALVRASRPGAGLAIVAGIAIFQAGLYLPRGWPAVVSRPAWWLVIGVGALAVAIVYDRLAAAGHRIGKCLIAGPLLAGIYVAAAPTALLESVSAHAILPELLLHAFLGILIGDGVALGVELAELLPSLRPRPTEGPSGSRAVV